MYNFALTCITCPSTDTGIYVVAVIILSILLGIGIGAKITGMSFKRAYVIGLSLCLWVFLFSYLKSQANAQIDLGPNDPSSCPPCPTESFSEQMVFALRFMIVIPIMIAVIFVANKILAKLKNT